MGYCKDTLIDTASFSPASLQPPEAWIGHLPFAAWIIRTLDPSIFVELGTHSGNSYFSFCQAVSESKQTTKCYAVDTWLGEEHAGFYGKEVFRWVNAYNQEHYADFSRLLRMKFDEAVNYFSDGSIDLLHIDGLHTYEAVKHDFETWQPKLAPGAVILFHDTNVRERGFGVWKLWEELQGRYPNHLEFTHSHGLGVLQLDGGPVKKKLEWLQPSSPIQKNLKDYFSTLGIRQLERFDLGQMKITVRDHEARITNLNQFLAERDGQIASLNQVLSERDGQIASLNQALSERDGQIASLNQILSERDGQIASLNQVLSERDGQIASLNQALSERDGQIASLNQILFDRDTTLREIQDSTIWRLSEPLRWYGHQKRRVQRLFNVLPSMIFFAGGALPLFKRALNVWHYNGLDGVKKVARNFIQKTEIPSTDLSLPILNPRVNDYEKGLVTIAILTKNRMDLIKPCIESIENHLSKKYKIEIVIGDTGSTENKVWNFYKKAMRKYRNIKVEMLKYYFFSKNYNELIRHFAKGQFLILLNNDTIAQKGWIDSLVDPLEDKRIGIVGAKLLYNDNTIQHAGMEFDAACNGVHRYKKERREFKGALYKALTPAVTFACVAIRHDVYDRFRLNEEFREEGQDSDFCLRLNEAGFKILYNPEAEIYHLECSSRDWRKGENDRLLLRKKWGNKISEYASKKEQSVKFDENGYKNAIVIIRDDGIGDLLMGVSAFKNLRKKHPNKKLVLLTYERNIEMMNGFNIFNEIIPIPNGMKYYPLPIPTVGTKVYNLMDLEMHFGPNWSTTKQSNKVPRHISFCNALEVNSEFELPQMPDYPEAKEKVMKLINGAGFKKNDNFVVLNMLASNPARSWWGPYYPKLISAIEEIGFIPVVVGTIDCEYYKGNAIINLTGKTETITEYIESIKLGKYVISTDTSAYHVAALSGIPFLTIFTGGVTPESRLSFYSKYEFVEPSNELDCYPCWDEGCKDLSIRWKQDPCRLSIKPEVVIEKFKKMVSTM